jgi:methyl-accepting chemotaxis protein
VATRTAYPEESERARARFTLRPLLHKVWEGLRSASKRQSSGALAGAIADLQTLNRRTEDDFLAVGAKLEEFLGTARRIAADMAALAQLISAEAGQPAAEVLGQVLERSRQSEARAQAGNLALAAADEAIRRIQRTFGGFGDTVAMFHVLGSLARIETARLGSSGADFGNLAAEVKSLTANIESSGQGIVDASAVLNERMQQAIARAAGLRAQELRELPELIGEVLDSLGSLAERHARAREASSCQSADYEQVSAVFGDLITSIQFHDVTRQQIEHVAEALANLNAGDAPNASSILMLQSSQLAHTERVFLAAVERIERALAEIAARVDAMAEASRTLLGVSTDEQDSFFLRMEGRFSAILRILEASDRTVEETRTTLGDLTETAEKIRVSAGQVRDVEIRIRRLALNATIRAAEIGEAGNALGVLAEVMHRLAVDSGTIADEVSEALDGVCRRDGQPGDGEDSAGPDGMDGLRSDLRQTILDLHSTSESSFSRLQAIVALGRRLRDGIQTVRAGFSAGALFAETFQRVQAALQQAGGQAGLSQAAEHGLDQLARKYTMQAERDVHEAVALGASAGASPAAETAIAVAEEEDMGDNVELF